MINQRGVTLVFTAFQIGNSSAAKRRHPAIANRMRDSKEIFSFLKFSAEEFIILRLF